MSQPSFNGALSDDDFNDILNSIEGTDPASPDTPTDEDIEDIEIGDDEDGDDTDESDPDTDGDEEGEDGAEEPELYTVKVDGEELEVTLEEMSKGYMRQQKFTQKLQAFSAKEKEWDSYVEEVGPQLQRISTLDSAWDEDPIEVLSAFTLSTTDPNLAIIEQVKRVAAAGKLNARLATTFGITDEVQAQLAQEVTSGRESAKAKSAQQELEELRAEQARERATNDAIRQYEADIVAIVSENDIAYATPAEQTEFRRKLAKYARDNDIQNLKTAYRLMALDDAEQGKQSAAKTRTKKTAASTVRKGANGSGSTTPIAKKGSSFESSFDESWNEIFG